jgi:hypothetical protein
VSAAGGLQRTAPGLVGVIEEFIAAQLLTLPEAQP